jgi:mannose-1-phosphate guanylyltransferase
MDSFHVEHHRLWSIILAGGESDRLRPLIQRWLGCYKPKQYCVFTGTRSMLQHTVDRALRLTTPGHTVTVCAGVFQREALLQLNNRQPSTVLPQPVNRGTVAEIFVPLAYIRARDRYATVVVYPSDHFVYAEANFLATVKRAILVSQCLKNRLILLGAPPTHFELDYGVILPVNPLAFLSEHNVLAVESVLEKPGLPRAREAWKQGCLWNTLICVAKVETLWELGWRCLPELMPLFEPIVAAIGSSKQKAAVRALYQALPPMDFSSEILQKVPEQLAVMMMNDVIWSLWEEAERIVESLRRIGKEPLFPLELLTDHLDTD